MNDNKLSLSLFDWIANSSWWLKGLARLLRKQDFQRNIDIINLRNIARLENHTIIFVPLNDNDLYILWKY